MSEQNDKKEDSPVEGVQKDLSQRIDEVINEDNQNKEKEPPPELPKPPEQTGLPF